MMSTLSYCAWPSDRKDIAVMDLGDPTLTMYSKQLEGVLSIVGSLLCFWVEMHLWLSPVLMAVLRRKHVDRRLQLLSSPQAPTISGVVNMCVYNVTSAPDGRIV